MAGMFIVHPAEATSQQRKSPIVVAVSCARDKHGSERCVMRKLSLMFMKLVRVVGEAIVRVFGRVGSCVLQRMDQTQQVSLTSVLISTLDVQSRGLRAATQPRMMTASTDKTQQAKTNFGQNETSLGRCTTVDCTKRRHCAGTSNGSERLKLLVCD